MKKKNILLTVSCLLFGGYLTSAQETNNKNTDKTERLEEVVIVASRKPTKISDIPGTVWIVPKQKLKTLIATGVPIKEMLGQLIPSMDAGSQGRTNFGQNMRGRAMLVMIDGVSLNSLRGVSRQLDAIDPFNIERIEVLSGASSIYGGNATGGIINIITKTAKKDQFGGETKLSYRSGFAGKEDGDYTISQAFTLKDDKVSARLGVSYQQNGGTYGADNKQIFSDITQTDLQYNESIDVLATTKYKFNEKHSLSLMAQYYNSQFNGDRVLSLGKNFAGLRKPSLLEMKNGFQTDKETGTQRYMGILSYRGKDILGGQDLHIQLASRGEFLGFYPFPTVLPKIVFTSASEQNTKYQGIKLVLHKNFNDFNITYGVDTDFEDFEAFQHVFNPKKSIPSGGLINETIFDIDRYPTVDSKSYAGYFQGKYKIIPTLTLNGGIRYQYNNVTVGDFIGRNEQLALGFKLGKSADVIKGGSSSYNVFLANAGLLFKPTENHQVWTTFSQGAKLADPAKLYGVGKYQINMTTGNWDLKTSVNINDTELQGIVTNQYELGYRTNFNRFKAQLAGFYTLSEKSIEVKNNSGNLVISVEDKNLRNMGVEMELSYAIDNGFYAGANALIIKSEIKNKDQWEKQSIFTASPSKVSAYFGYNKNNLSVRLQNQQLFDLEDSAKNKIKGFNLFDATVAYQTPFGKFSLGAQNILNTDYQTIWSARAQALYGKSAPKETFYYKGRGRTFNISYNLEF